MGVMRMPDYFTIAMSEMWTGSFKVICYGFSEKSFISVHMKQQDIIGNNGEIKWDLFAATEAVLQPTGSEYFRLNEEGRLKGYCSKNDAKKFFSKLCIEASNFYNSDETYAIIAPNSITIHPPEVDDRVKCKVSFFCNNFSRSNVLNKDYRMLNYWGNLKKTQLEEKAAYWQKYLQLPDRQVYLVLYNHVFPHGATKKWIVGFHCL